MAEITFSRRFLRDLAEWEGTASPRDVEALDRTLATLARQPEMPGRVPSFYDPTAPSWLYRADAVLIHYRAAQNGNVESLNLFFPRP